MLLLQKKLTGDSSGEKCHTWEEWLASQAEQLPEAERGEKHPSKHSKNTLRRYLKSVPKTAPKGAADPARADVAQLANQIRRMKRSGVKHMSGKFFEDWVADQEHLTARERKLRDPIRHSAETLRRFLGAVPDGVALEDLVSKVKELQRRGAKDAEGREWEEWVAALGDALPEAKRGKVNPSQHGAATLKAFVEAVENRASTQQKDQIEAQELATIVKGLSRRKVVNEQGKTWKEWQAAGHASIPEKDRGLQDPSRHSAETLRAFLETCPESESAVLAHRMRRRRRANRALEDLRQLYLAAKKPVAAEAACLFSLIERTRVHHRFTDHYGSMPTHKDGWVSVPVRGKGEVQEHSLFPPKPTSLLVAIDCEMVATKSDDSALARVCACNAEGKVLLDKLVKPPEEVTDARTNITRIKLEDLNAVEYTLEDAQRDLLALCSPQTVLVGHTLFRDLIALRLDAPLVIDISYLYALKGMPTRAASLLHLVEQVLGRSNFRGADGYAPHECLDDVRASMDILLTRLRQLMASAATTSPVAAIIEVPPPVKPQRPPEESARPLADAARTIQVHSLPERPGVVTSIVALLAIIGHGAYIESVELQDGNARAKADGLRSALIVFADAATAACAFDALPDTAQFDALASTENGTQRPKKQLRGDDRQGRPQKEVILRSADGREARVWFHAGVTLAQRDAAAVAAFAAQLAAQRNEARQNGAVVAPCREADVAGDSRKRRWPGWRAAMDEELREAPEHAMPWKRLRRRLVERAVAAGVGEDEADLKAQALASVPESYCSADDAMVRLPA